MIFMQFQIGEVLIGMYGMMRSGSQKQFESRVVSCYANLNDVSDEKCSIIFNLDKKIAIL